MARFVGTVQEFHHFIGPKIRNAVNYAARKHRNRLGGVCENCGAQAELHSAHIHGRDRRTLIEAALRDDTNETGVVDCDVEGVERKIIDSHLPIEDTFKFMCHACHVAYDAAGPKTRRAAREFPPTATRAPGEEEFLKLNRIERWASRPHQINHRIVRAFLELERDGEVEYSSLQAYCTEKLDVRNFDANFVSMTTDAGNAHGKVFRQDGSRVTVCPAARKEIELHFGANHIVGK